MQGDVLRKIAYSSSMPSLWKIVTKIYQDLGFGEGAYFLLRTLHDKPASIPYSYGSAPEVLSAYTSLDFCRLDVLPRVVIAKGTPMTWAETWSSIPLSDEEIEFHKVMMEVKSGPGIAIPCYGPNQRNGYVMLSDYSSDISFDAKFLAYTQMIAQSAHLRLCQMFIKEKAETQISRREREILGWVALGKSNTVIGDILGISANTVDTHLRRIYRKFDVVDRTSAAIKAVGLGLIAT